MTVRFNYLIEELILYRQQNLELIKCYKICSIIDMPVKYSEKLTHNPLDRMNSIKPIINLIKLKFLKVTKFYNADNILSTMSDVLFLLNADGNIIDVNQASMKITKFNRHELINQNIDFLFTNGSSNPTDFLEHIRSDESSHQILTLKDKNNKLIPVGLSCSSIKNHEGSVTAILCIAREIKEGIQAEKSIKEIEESYHYLFNKTPAMLISIDIKFKIFTVSDSFCSKMGYKQKEVIGRKLTDFLTKDSKNDLVRTIFPEFLKKGSIEQRTLKIKKNSGEIINALVSLVAQKKEKEEIATTLVTITDISELKTNANRVHVLTRAIEQSSSLIIVTDFNGIIEYANPKFTEVTGYTAEEIIEKKIGNLISGDENTAEFSRIWDKLIMESEWHGEFQNKKKNGENFWTYTSISPIINDVGEITHFIAVQEDLTDRKKVEVKINSLAKFANENPQPVIRVSPAGKVLYSNKATTPLYACVVAIENEFLPKDLQKIVKEVYENNTMREIEFACQDKTYNLVFTPILEEEYINIYGYDITEGKNAEKSLITSEEKYRNLIDNIQDGVFIIQDEKFQFINDSFAKMVGYKIEELQGASFDKIVAPEDLEMVTERYKRRQAGEKVPNEYEFRMFHKDGRKRVYVNMTVGLINFKDKIASMGTVKDISKRKKAEERLRISEEKYRTLFEDSRDVIYISTPGGRFLDINPAGLELFGYSSKEEIMKINITTDLYRDPEARDNFKNLMEQQGFVKDYRDELKTKNNETLIVLETSTPLKDSNSNTIAYRGIIRDVTQELALEAQLQQSQKMEAVGNLAGGIAHDFNNLLTAINGFAEISVIRFKEGNPHRNNLLSILKAAKRASNLTRQLLAFSRKQVIEPIIMDVNHLITDLLKMLQRLIGENITINLELSNNIGHIKADPGQIEQILVNLIVNSRDAINDESHKASKKLITIQTFSAELNAQYRMTHPGSSEGRHVVISVSDTGVGLSPKIQNKIFEPFFTTKPMGKGTGLGLATVYGIVKQNNSAIYVYSEPGKGTTFKIYWPYAEQELASFPEEELFSDIKGGNENILFVEDDEEVRQFGCSALRSLGYKVVGAQDGIDALQFVKKNRHQFDLLITDVIMPEIGGKELAEKIVKFIPNIKILFTSGYTDNHIVHGGLLESGVKFLQKPYSISVLAEKVRDVLSGTGFI
jgi:PAS domain S-box-containing protein